MDIYDTSLSVLYSRDCLNTIDTHQGRYDFL